MAQLAGTLTTSTIVGSKESVADAIYDVSTKETPFTRLVGDSMDAENTFHTWHIDKLRAPASNKKPQGNNYGFALKAQPEEQGNYMQIADDTLSVTGTTEAIKMYGRKNKRGGELVRQRKKMAAEIMLDVEHQLVGVNEASEQNAAGNTCGSFTSFLKSNTSRGAGGADGGYDSTTKRTVAATDGTLRTLTEGMVQDVQESCFDQGGHPNFIMLPTGLKRQFSGFKGLGEHRQTHAVTPGSKRQATILAAADFYIGDFGVLASVVNKFQRDRDVHLIDPNMVCVDYLRRFKREKLAKRSDSTDEAMVVEFTLVNKNEAAHGTIADVQKA